MTICVAPLGNRAREVEEFTNGLRRMKGGARSKDILDMLKRLRTSLSQAEALQHDVECPGGPCRHVFCSTVSWL